MKAGGAPEPVRVHDFKIPELGKVAPYGVYDIAANTGWVNVRIDHDTAAFAFESIRRWARGLGPANAGLSGEGWRYAFAAKWALEDPLFSPLPPPAGGRGQGERGRRTMCGAAHLAFPGPTDQVRGLKAHVAPGPPLPPEGPHLCTFPMTARAWQRAWSLVRPWRIVIGPGGLSEAYPFQPPRRAMIQVAQAREAAGGEGVSALRFCLRGSADEG